MTTTHTPGPWIADKLLDRNAYNIFASGHCTALLTLEPGKYDGASPLCRNVAADARLIAAAPDLLAALKTVADYWAGGDVPPEIDALMRAAIARATNA
jgi:hypothetical protein